MIRIFCGAKFKENYLRVYQKKQKNINRFSLLYFSEKVKDATLQSITREYKIDHYVLISPSFRDVNRRNKSSSFTIRGLIEMDPQLAWFWPILKRRQLKKKSGKILSGSLDTFFN